MAGTAEPVLDWKSDDHSSESDSADDSFDAVVAVLCLVGVGLTPSLVCLVIVLSKRPKSYFDKQRISNVVHTAFTIGSVLASAMVAIFMVDNKTAMSAVIGLGLCPIFLAFSYLFWNKCVFEGNLCSSCDSQEVQSTTTTTWQQGQPTTSWQSPSPTDVGGNLNNTQWLNDMEQRRQQEQCPPYGPYSAPEEQRPPYSPYSGSPWTMPGPSAPPNPNASVPKVPPGQTMPPPRQPAFNPEVENNPDVLPSYDDAVTDGAGTSK